MGEGWETARRRDDGNDWVSVRLAAEGIVQLVELDTSHFKGNAPGWATVTCAGTKLLDRQRLQPDTRHLFLVDSEIPATEARLDVHPDGGMARMRLYGSPTTEGLRQLAQRWTEGLPR
jgi:allantoicase